MTLSLTSEGFSDSDIQRARNLHLGELAYADEKFGELLAQLDEWGMLANTVIVAVADHGELFGEHGRMAHSGGGHEELLHVPLVMLFPDADFHAATIDEKVDLRDIKPTLLAYLGIEDTTSRGRSLLGLFGGESGKAATLPAPNAMPVRDASEHGAENIIGRRDPETTKRLKEELRGLGYIE